MRRLVSCDSAVAACPAPIVATSRRPSRRRVSMSLVMTSLRASGSGRESYTTLARSINKRRPAVIQHGRAGDPARHPGRAARSVAPPHRPGRCTASASRATRWPLASNTTAGRRRRRVIAAVLQQPAQIHDRQRVAAHEEHGATILLPDQFRLAGHQLDDVRQRHDVALLADAGHQCAHDPQSRRQPDARTPCRDPGWWSARAPHRCRASAPPRRRARRRAPTRRSPRRRC